MRLLSLLLLLSLVLPSVLAHNICVLQVPLNPLSATGLATPYVVTGCFQSLAFGTFVQGAILDLDTGKISVYNPLVITSGSTPAVVPTPPTLPPNAVVGLWFGTNGLTLTLTGTIDPATGVSSLVHGNCVNGGGNPFSIFGQYASCNGGAFFAAANSLIQQGLLKIPPIGVDTNGKPCPTTRDFGIVDQDPSDNTDTTYLLVTATGQTAQNTPQNQATIGAGKFTIIDNGSDELLVTLVQQALGCKGYTVPDLADPTGATLVSSFPTNELQARQGQRPFAYVEFNDPMTLNAAGALDINKLNAYRATIGQLPLTSVNQDSLVTFCNNLYAVGAPKILEWLPLTLQAPAPDFAVGLSNTLGGVLIARFGATVGAGNLNCVGANVLNLPNPFAGFTFTAVASPVLVPPAGLVSATGAIIPPATAATILGIGALAPINDGQIGDPSLTPQGFPAPIPPVISGAAGACYLQVPADPLSAKGLATPYLVSGDGCLQTLGSATFVQGVILDTDKGTLFAYNPLVIVAGTLPSLPPTVPVLPANFEIGLWFGTNGGSTTLVGTFSNGVDSLSQGRCTNGGGSTFSIFGQFAACNAVAFFAAAQSMINAGTLVVPNPGKDVNGNPCPTTRDFGVVDQDSDDNTDTTYLIDANGLVAQNTFVNQQVLTKNGVKPTVIDNGSDELLITKIAAAIGCNGLWLIPDKADTTGVAMVSTVATNSLQARFTNKPLAFVPANHAMVLNTNTVPPSQDLDKLNQYRMSVGELPVYTLAAASGKTYCNNLYAIGAPKIASWFPLTLKAPAPDFAAGLSNSLAGVLVARFNAAVAALNCQQLIGMPSPFATFTFTGATNSLVFPAGIFNADGTLAQPTLTLQSALGVQNLVADLTNQFGDPQLDANGNPLPTGVPGAAGPGGIVGGCVAVQNANAVTTNNNDTTALSPMWLGIGVAAGVVLSIIVGIIIFKAMSGSSGGNDKSRYNQSNLAMANGV